MRLLNYIILKIRIKIQTRIKYNRFVANYITITAKKSKYNKIHQSYEIWNILKCISLEEWIIINSLIQFMDTGDEIQFQT